MNTPLRHWLRRACDGLSLLSLCPLMLAQDTPVWKWDYPQIETTVRKVRAGRDLTPRPWPG